ncbi:MAG: endonuclease [Oceanospirillaceae bacterium]|nr:endonuclease [Oceanospirillaceae bacterium]
MKIIKTVLCATLLALAYPSMAIEIHTPHCIAGCPAGVEQSNDLIVRDSYTISSNDRTKFTDWAAYKVTSKTIGSGCKRNWKPDPELTDRETLEPSDYKGANAAIGIDRGHQVPLASFCGTSRWYELNYLSNITPQKSALNQNSWKHLEEKVRTLAKKGNEVYVLTGPLYERKMPALPGTDEPHKLPSGYWKVIALVKGKSIQTASFIFDQDTPKKADFCKFRASASEVEKRSKLDLFPSITVKTKLLDGKLEKAFCRK